MKVETPCYNRPVYPFPRIVTVVSNLGNKRTSARALRRIAAIGSAALTTASNRPASVSLFPFPALRHLFDHEDERGVILFSEPCTDRAVHQLKRRRGIGKCKIETSRRVDSES